MGFWCNPYFILTFWVITLSSIEWVELIFARY